MTRTKKREIEVLWLLKTLGKLRVYIYFPQAILGAQDLGKSKKGRQADEKG